MKKYRMLTKKEIVRNGDEVKNPFGGDWTNGHLYSGMAVKDCFGALTGLPREFRRPIKAKSARPVRRGRPLNKLQAAIDSIVKEFTKDQRANITWKPKVLLEKLNQLAAL